MKKLMLTAAAAAMATGAFAVDPQVYSYTASITHMYVRLVNVNQQVNFAYGGGFVQAGTVTVYQKYKKVSTLTGYLVQDTEGAASRNLNPYYATVANSGSPVYDQGRNRAFLIVENSTVEANVRRPKIIPAVLEAKWYDTAFRHDARGTVTETAGTAQGILYAGGEILFGRMGAGVRAKLDVGTDLPFNEHPIALVNPGAKSRTPTWFADHLWTSCYLFGQYNGPQWSGNAINLQTAINAALPNYFALPANLHGQPIFNGNALSGTGYYHDSWLNHTGIGTYTLTNPGVDEICCGLSIGGLAAAKRLNQLSGNMKGGVFICSDNGYIQAPGIYEPFLGWIWEDQFWSQEANTAADRNYYRYNNYNVVAGAGAWVANADAHQADVWTDGNIAQNTTDVLYGTWSITRLATNIPKRAITWEERNLLATATYPSNTALPEAEWTTIPGAEGTQAVPLTTDVSSDDLLQTIKGCAFALNPNTTFLVRAGAFRSREIYDYTPAERFQIPFLTTRFARAYGLAVYR